MHRTNSARSYTSVSGVTASVSRHLLSFARALMAAVLDAAVEAARNAVCAVLVHLTAEPYTADELDDPFLDFEDYELARELLAIESLITGRIGALLGPATVMQLFGGVELPMQLAHCIAALRETPDGDTIYLCFELDLAAPTTASGGFAVEVLRVSGSAPGATWDAFESTPHADAILALTDFYSDRAPHPGRSSR